MRVFECCHGGDFLDEPRRCLNLTTNALFACVAGCVSGVIRDVQLHAPRFPRFKHVQLPGDPDNMPSNSIFVFQSLCADSGIHVHAYTFVCIWFHGFAHEHARLFPERACLCAHECVYVELYVSVCLPICLSICLFIYLSIYLPVYLSACLSVCLSV